MNTVTVELNHYLDLRDYYEKMESGHTLRVVNQNGYPSLTYISTQEAVSDICTRLNLVIEELAEEQKKVRELNKELDQFRDMTLIDLIKWVFLRIKK